MPAFNLPPLPDSFILRATDFRFPAPYAANGHAYVTNGHLIVRVPCSNSDGMLDGAARVAGFERVLLHDYAGPWHRPRKILRRDAVAVEHNDFAYMRKHNGKRPVSYRVAWHGAWLSWEYYDLLRSLPGAEFGEAIDANSATPIKFAGGGVGCVMPLRSHMGEAPAADSAAA